MKPGTIEQTVAILTALMRGAILERRSLARLFGVTVATSDRYIRAMAGVPGVVLRKQGEKLLVSFSFGEALRGLGR